MRLIYHPDAESELIEGAAPERWRIIEEGVRSYLMPRFPYAVYYRDFPAAFTSFLSNITGDT